MSEKKPKPCANKCKCAPPPKKETPNGKGDAPRNLSTQFRSNYDSINWKPKKK